jgi:hypothetical protein
MFVKAKSNNLLAKKAFDLVDHSVMDFSSTRSPFSPILEVN